MFLNQRFGIIIAFRKCVYWLGSGERCGPWPSCLYAFTLWPFSPKFLPFLVRFSVKNFVREILRAFHKRFRSLFNLKISLTRKSSLARSQTVKIISIENEPRFSQSESILQTTVHQYRVKSMWCKSSWKLTSQSLHVCKNRSI